MRSLCRLLGITGLLWVLAFTSVANAQGVLSGIPKPDARDLCPVCGMIVSKYPNWVATVVYKDGHAHHFDGAKDMFKYLQDLPKYAPGHRKEDIRAIAVTDFYNLGKVDARQAWFVIGSDVLGPMGHEFVPLENKTDADEHGAAAEGEKAAAEGEHAVAAESEHEAEAAGEGEEAHGEPWYIQILPIIVAIGGILTAAHFYWDKVKKFDPSQVTGDKDPIRQMFQGILSA